MSKSIQIISRNFGVASLCVKGESRVVNFKPIDRDGVTVGVAMCDHDEASALLRIPQDYWKPGQSADDVLAMVNDSLEAAAAEGKKNKEDAEAKVGGEGAARAAAGTEADRDDDKNSENTPDPMIAEIAGLNNYNALKSALKKCDSIEIIRAVLAIEIAKEDPKEYFLTLLNERITHLHK